MTETRWEHFDHKADMGVRGFGSTKAEAFEQAALALTAVVTDLERVEPRESIIVTCEASDDEALLVDWLNALILEMATRKMLFSRFEIQIEDEKRGTGVPPVNHAQDAHAEDEKRGTGVPPVNQAQDAHATIKLHGQAWGENIDVARHEPAVEVKGATYTALRVQKDDDRWRAQCVVDVDELAGQGIILRCASSRGVAEEAPGAYKDVNAVVEAADAAGLSLKVARLKPLICVKG